MTDPTVIVVHPAPIVHVPRGGRHERIEFVRARTPVAFKRAHADAFEPCDWSAFSDDERVVLKDADGFWSPLQGRRGDVREDDLLRGLSDGASRTVGYFPMSPFQAIGRSVLDDAVLPARSLQGNATRIVHDDLGTTTDPEASRSIREDGRPDAARRLVEWVSRNVRSIGGIVHERRLPLATLHCRHEPSKGDLFHWVTDATPRCSPGFRLTVAAPDSLARLTSRYERDDRSVLPGSTAEWASAVGDALPAGHDAARVAAQSCHAIRAHIDATLGVIERLGRLDHAAALELASAREGVLRGELLAMTDGFGHDDPAEALRIVLRGLDALWEAPREIGEFQRLPFPGAIQLAADIRHGYLPALAADMDPDDAESLGALLPG